LNQTYHFTRLKEIAEYVKAITKDQVIMFFDKYVAALAPCRRKLCVQVFAKQHQERMASEVGDGVVLIENPEEFRHNMMLYPLPKKVVIEIHEESGAD
jgi:secreted Zn-dependent insulinase-like peptidase